MKVVFLSAVVALVVVMPSPALAQEAKATVPAKSTTRATREKKSTKATPPVTFEAHNEGSVEGAIYGDENLVLVIIDIVGIRYRTKRDGKETSIPWAQIAGWQANNFTSRNPARAGDGDFGIGIYQGAIYLSFRTRRGSDYLAAIKSLRALAAIKERPGMG